MLSLEMIVCYSKITLLRELELFVTLRVSYNRFLWQKGVCQTDRLQSTQTASISLSILYIVVSLLSVCAGVMPWFS